VEDDGSGLRRLTDGGHPGPGEYDDGIGDAHPAWSVDGAQILFGRGIGSLDGANNNTTRFYAVGADGTNEHEILREDNLPDGYKVAAGPYPAPDGRSILFAANRFGGASSALFSVNLDGSDLKRITPINETAWAPAISPDGRRVAYQRTTFQGGVAPGPSEPVPSQTDLYMMDPDGSNQTRLTMGDLQLTTWPMSMSPDGRYLAFSSGEHLYTMSLADGRLVERDDGRFAGGPAWANFGRTLLYSAIESNSSTFCGCPIWARDMLTGDVKRVTADSGFTPAWYPLGGSLPGLPSLPKDVTPPSATLLPASPRSRTSAHAAAAARPGDTIRFLVVDRSGIRRVDAAVGRRAGRGMCRFLVGRRLGPKRACSRPLYRRVRGGLGWSSRVRHLRAGTYEVRFRTTDVRGNGTRHPKRHVVRVR
jgi:hypothetical protein